MRKRNPSRFWGRSGAGILFVCLADKTMMLVKRSEEVEQPGEWGIPGGSCSGEDFFSDDEGEEVTDAVAWACAVRETEEELGYFPKKHMIEDRIVFKQRSFTYTTFVVSVSRKEKERLYQNSNLNWENTDLMWRKISLVKENEPDLHFGVKFIIGKFK